MNFIKKHLIKIIFALIIVMIPIILAGVYFRFINTPSSTQNKSIVLRITKGMNSSVIIDKLYDEDLISNKTLAKLYMKSSSIGNSLKAGVYKFNLNMTPKQIFDMLKNRKIDLDFVNFTIPEGYTVRQIGEKLYKSGLISSTTEFYSSVQKDEFKYEFLKNSPKNRTYRLEGYLFPDTYEFEKGMTIQYMLNKMLNKFNSVYTKLKPKFGKGSITLDKAIIIASMIEGEAKIDGERSMIAAVIFNRLKVNMKLQIDATVQYTMSEHKNVLYLKDLRVDSPYNTYKYKGLPVGPICNPGEKSIEAALNPVKANYIYYIAKGNGEHFFTNSYKKFINYKNSLKNN